MSEPVDHDVELYTFIIGSGRRARRYPNIMRSQLIGDIWLLTYPDGNAIGVHLKGRDFRIEPEVVRVVHRH